MNESAKTLSVVVGAAVLVLVAVLTRPRLPSAAEEGVKDQLLFPDWKDPTAAKSLEISSIDEATGSLRDFKVADINGKWVIPSHSNYPANAEQNVVTVASNLINLKILGVVSDIPGDHETYGVVEPDEIKLAPGAVGVGKLVVVQDGGGKDLARLIIGKEDKAPGPDSPANLRFVRRAGQDRVYRVALATDLFSTKFQEWIDPDLLDLKKQWDINALNLRDYTIEGALVRKWDLDLAFDVDKSIWSVKKLTDYKDNQPVPGKLGPDEELDTAKLNDLKMTASGLKIAEVRRKPDALIAKLKAGKDYLSDPALEQALEQHGFLPFPEKKPTDLLAFGGDMTIGMKDGVEYAVRFGPPGVSVNEGGDKKDKKPGSPADKDSKHSTDVRRLVFVTARFNPDLIPKPALEPLPTAKKPEETKPEPKKPDETKPPGNKPEEKKPEATKPAEAKPEEKKPEEKKPDEKVPDKNAPDKSAPDKNADKSSSTQHSEYLLALADGPPASKSDDKKSEEAKPGEKKPDEKKPDEQKPEDKKPDAKPADDKKPAEKPAEPPKTAAGEPTSDIKKAEAEQALEAERKRVETENRGKQDQYDQTVKQGKDRAKQLNARFADWFYMIAEDDYKKLHVSRSEIIKKKPGAGPTLGPGPQDPFKIPKPPLGIPGEGN